MTSDTWIRSLESELMILSPTVRELVLRDAREVIREVGDDNIHDVLGDPADYANAARNAFVSEKTTDEPQAHLGPVTVDFRGLTNSAVRSRLWDPTNPRIFTSKIFGIGWDINLGAIAVKLGLLRPDDYDDEAVRAIPPTIWRCSTGYPVVLSVIAACQTLRGRSSFGNALLAILPTIWSQRAVPRTEDALVRNAIASGAVTLAVGTTLQRNSRKTNGST
ncbi:MAG: DUF5808 domain-containing protein, partial [Thermomicrobiales bacterium]|nr:DUF5808 domain-containing protein [Thermomicrobiales bacterium]